MQAEVGNGGTAGARGWREWLYAYTRPRVVAMLLLGFSAGLPLLLIFSSLSIWLTEAGVERASVTLFSWAALGYSFKFVWAPLLDKMPLPLLTHRLGRRRSWLLVAQAGVVIGILGMAFTDPQQTLLPMAIAALVLGFSSATQDILIDAYRIESAPQPMQALLAAAYIAGYRVGMLVAGAGALKLAAAFGGGEGYDYSAWRLAYIAMAAMMAVGVVTTLLIREPENEPDVERYVHSTGDYLRFLLLFLVAVIAFVATFAWGGGLLESAMRHLVGATEGGVAGFITEAMRLAVSLAVAWFAARTVVALKWVDAATFRRAYVEPAADFFWRYGRFGLLILLLVGLYRISDIVLGVISNVFYTDRGYTKDQIADIAKTFGLLMTLVGGFVGGGLALRWGVMRALLLGAVLSALTNLLFLLLAESEPTLYLLVLVIAADNLSGGLASAAFVAYLSGLTNISFTAFQYAVFSSLMTLIPKLLGGYSGRIVDAIGYSDFFVLSTLLGLPVIGLVWLAGRRDAGRSG